ncbi:MAG: VOC family protein [Anaerolineae bacterium]|nr:VOC family protein [Anaerolineae bacterium]
MIAGICFAHVNLVAHDWRRLARFYEEVLGCVPVPPPRDLSGPTLEAATGVRGAHLVGAHLRLPGYDDTGPTLEIFQYESEVAGPTPAINRPGLGHLAFAVADVEEARDAVLQAGGGAVGEIVRLAVPDAGTVTFLYATDPEGNILELQSWARE